MKAKKSFGLYLLLAAAVLTVIAMVLYGSSFATDKLAYLFLGLSLAAAAVSVGMSFTKLTEVANLAAGVATVLLFIGFCITISPMVTPIAYWYSGLYDYSTVSAYFTFAAVWVIAWLAAMVCSFTGVAKRIK